MAEVDWQTALEFVANGLKSIAREHGAASVGALLSPHSTLEELHLRKNSCAAWAARTSIRGFARRLLGRRESQRRAVAGMPVADIADLSRLLVIGSFLRKDHPLLAQRVRQAAKRGLRVSYSAPMPKTGCCRCAVARWWHHAGMVGELAGWPRRSPHRLRTHLRGACRLRCRRRSAPRRRPSPTTWRAATRPRCGSATYAVQHPDAATSSSWRRKWRLAEGSFGIIGEAATASAPMLPVRCRPQRTQRRRDARQPARGLSCSAPKPSSISPIRSRPARRSSRPGWWCR